MKGHGESSSVKWLKAEGTAAGDSTKYHEVQYTIPVVDRGINKRVGASAVSLGGLFTFLSSQFLLQPSFDSLDSRSGDSDVVTQKKAIL